MKKIFLIFTLFLSMQSWANDIRLIVPFAAGGPADRLARLVQKDVREIGGKNLIVENRPGGNSEVALSYMLQFGKNEPVFMIVGTAIGFALRPQYDNAGIDAVADLGKSTVIITVPKNSKITSFQDLLTIDKNTTLTYGNSGNGSMSYLVGETLKQNINKNLVSVSYQTTPRMFPDLVSGQLDIGITHVYDIIQFIEKQQVVPLAVFSENRITEFPNVPTVKEFGIKDSVMHTHWMLIGPSTNSKEDVAFIQSVLTKSLNDANARQPYRLEGLKIVPGDKKMEPDWWQKEIYRTRDIINRLKSKQN